MTMRKPTSRNDLPGQLVLGLDPGFASCGYAVVRVRPDDEDVVALGVLRTAASSAKRKVYAADDNLRRCRELAAALANLTHHGQVLPLGGRQWAPRVRAVCAEAMSFPRNASTAAKMAMTWGLIVANVESKALPLLQASPQEVKVKLTAHKDAPKEAIEDALLRRYGKRLKSMLRELPEGQHEHAFDALAAVVTCLDAEVVRLMRSMVA